MTKKDRIAIVLSLAYLLFPLWIYIESRGRDGETVFLFCLPVLIYWGYRFIKNDISFLRIKEKD